MRTQHLAALTALVAAVSLGVVDTAEARGHKKRGEPVLVLKKRSFLDAGTQVQPGSRQGYSLGMTPFRPSDTAVPTGSAQQRLLPGPFGVAW